MLASACCDDRLTSQGCDLSLQMTCAGLSQVQDDVKIGEHMGIKRSSSLSSESCELLLDQVSQRNCHLRQLFIATPIEEVCDDEVPVIEDDDNDTNAEIPPLNQPSLLTASLPYTNTNIDTHTNKVNSIQYFSSFTHSPNSSNNNNNNNNSSSNVSLSHPRSSPFKTTTCASCRQPHDHTTLNLNPTTNNNDDNTTTTTPNNSFQLTQQQQNHQPHLQLQLHQLQQGRECLVDVFVAHLRAEVKRELDRVVDECVDRVRSQIVCKCSLVVAGQ